MSDADGSRARRNHPRAGAVRLLRTCLAERDEARLDLHPFVDEFF
ncbi:MAG: hypothetical protein WA047_19740 [Phenylobacterium sp.]